MRWNWEQSDWPNFSYDERALEPLERDFLLHAGELMGVFRHVSPDDRDQIRIDLISEEAVKTSAIEGEYLDRASVQSSLREQFGLGGGEARGIAPAERGIAEMMADVYLHYADPLSERTLFAWHRMVMAGERRIETVGRYREHTDADRFQSAVRAQGAFRGTAIGTSQRRDGCVHGVVQRNVAQRQISASSTDARWHRAPLFREHSPLRGWQWPHWPRSLRKGTCAEPGEPSLIALAYTIERHRKTYYRMLEISSRSNEISAWLVYFANTVLDAQRITLARVEFSVVKARFYERFRGQLNERQKKAIARMFREGIDGFKGGLSADNYIAITKASRATATRDLQDLVMKGALTRTGERRYTRYYLVDDEETR